MLLYGARRFFRNWGTTKEECRMHLPGDALVRPPVLQTTEGVSIDQSATAVWPWLVQMGQDRGGLYGYEFVENCSDCTIEMPSRIHPEWQRIAPGDTVRLFAAGWIGFATASRYRGGRHRRAGHRAPSGTTEPPVGDRVVLSLDSHRGDRCRLLVRTRWRCAVPARYGGRTGRSRYRADDARHAARDSPTRPRCHGRRSWDIGAAAAVCVGHERWCSRVSLDTRAAQWPDHPLLCATC